jgi:hypothetical protein
MTEGRGSRPSMTDATERVTVPGRAPGALPPLSLEAPPPTAPRVGLALGFAMGRERVLRRPTAVSAVVGAALVVVAGLIERRVGSAGAVDRTLVATFNVVIPLVSFGVAAQVSARGNLRESLWNLARYGVARGDAALGALGAALATSAALAAAFAVLAVGLAHGAGSPPILHDMLTSGWIAALTAAAYTGWFAAGATFGRHGGWRWLPLALDFTLGGSAGIAGAVLPRANAASLLGTAPLGMPQTSSSAILAASAAALIALAAVRCRE